MRTPGVEAILAFTSLGSDFTNDDVGCWMLDVGPGERNRIGKKAVAMRIKDREIRGRKGVFYQHACEGPGHVYSLLVMTMRIN